MNRIIKDIDRGLVGYPELKRVDKNGSPRVKGTIALTHPVKGQFDWYRVTIDFPTKYPQCFPRVIETSKKIPRIADRHVNNDNSLCLAVLPKEKAIVKNSRFSFKFFLDKILVPHLARETYRERKNKYPQGEYSHYMDGIWEYYEDTLGFSDRILILETLDRIYSSPKPKRNDKCPCGSEKKFKKCHLESWSEILKPGKDFLGEQIDVLKTNYNGK